MELYTVLLIALYVDSLQREVASLICVYCALLPPPYPALVPSPQDPSPRQKKFHEHSRATICIH